MEPIIAKCGIRCDLCPAYEANLKSEQDKHRMCTAFAKYFDYQIKPEEVESCKGCVAATVSPHKDCAVFPCAQAKGVVNCAHCEDFACEEIKKQMDGIQDCLDKHDDIPEEDFRRYIKPFFSKDTLMEIRKSMGK